MTTDAEDIQHVIELRKIKQRVLRLLEQQAAQYTGTVPTHISIQLEQTINDIKLLEERLRVVPHSQDALDAVGGDALGLQVSVKLKEFDQKFSSALQSFAVNLEEMARGQTAMKAVTEEWRRNEQEIRRERQQETDERQTELEKKVEIVVNQVSRIGDRFDWIVITLIAIVVVGSLVTILIVWAIR